MVRIGLMIEGQDGLTWERWSRLLEAAEALGFAHVFRSDHFTNPHPPDLESLELWVSLTYAATRTSRIEFGPLVAPVTFRHPSITARMAAAVDDLSHGRLTLGIGAGWQDREHRLFGVPFPSTATRYEMLEETLDVVTQLLRSDGPSHYAGKHYQLDGATLLPRPRRSSGPPILVGGNGQRRTLPLAAKYADEWNAVFVTPDTFRGLNAHLDTLLQQYGRSRESVKRSVMVGTLWARDERTLQSRLTERGSSLDDLTGRGLVAGTPAMWIDQLSAYREAGVQRIMLQWLEQDNLEDLENIARDVLPKVA